MGFDLRPTCKKCGKVLDLNKMRALENGGGFVCVNCFEHKTQSTFNPLRPREVKEEIPVPPPSMKKVDAVVDPITNSEVFFDQKEYKCDACQFVFKRDPEKKVKRCPYCGDYAVRETVETHNDDFVQQ